MQESYKCGFSFAREALKNGGKCLDCGANDGSQYSELKTIMGLDKDHYVGIEWNINSVNEAQAKGLNVIQGDINKTLPFNENEFQCVFGFSVLEHLLNGCQWINECRRILKPGGHLVILTPNISAWFTVFLLILGKMPSIGPHPDSLTLFKKERLVEVCDLHPDIEGDTPLNRHLVVFSYRVLKKYLKLCGFKNIKGYAFGLYPLPPFLQPLFERIDPWHCHQMVFSAEK